MVRWGCYMLKKVRAIIIKENNILLMRRVKDGREFYVFPGGRVKTKESFEAAVKRVIKEEFDIEIKIETFLFREENKGKTEFYFLVRDFEGELRISGEERQVINDNNQFCLEWKNLKNLKELSNLLPHRVKGRIAAELKKAEALVL